MLEKYLDEYEIKARVAPGLILAFPILVDAAVAAPVLSNLPIFAASGLCGFALIYGMSHVVRAMGDAIESNIWSKWGGPPSTRFIRHSDGKFGAELKESVNTALVKKHLSSGLLDSNEEANNPGGADQAISDAFLQVREFLRKRDPKGMWFKHNIDYGFCRNLLGCRILWAGIALAAIIFAAVNGIRAGAGLFNAASIIGCLWLLLALYVGWAVLPGATRRTADSYAASAWVAFLRLAG